MLRYTDSSVLIRTYREKKQGYEQYVPWCFPVEYG